MLVQHFLEDTARRLPNKVALVCGGKRHSYKALDDAATRLAVSLRKRGVGRGDRVMIFLPNRVEAVVSIYAALKAGAVFVPVNPLTKADKLAHLLNDVHPACLIADESLHAVWASALSHNSSVHTRVLVGPGAIPLEPHYLAYADAVRPRDVDAPAPVLTDEDLAAVIYTSGSTGRPKGAMFGHRNMIAAANAVIEYLGLADSDVILCVLPLSFGYGLYQVLMGFKLGATVVLEKSFAFPVKILETMAREKVTVFPAVPTVVALFTRLDDLARHDLKALRMITSAAAALSPEHIARLRDTFPQALLYSMYGLTECKRVTYLPPEQLDVRPGSVGRGMPNQEWWLADEAGNRLPNGSCGELVVRGPHVMRGYWGDPDETAKRLRPSPDAAGTVLYSGDIFRTDEEGYLYFVARKDDVIKSRGEKVSPREVEDTLYALEGVVEAAVIGVPDAILGQAVKAFVVLAPGYSYTEKDVIRHSLVRLESFMAPKHVQFMAVLPKTDSGKIKKTELR